MTSTPGVVLITGCSSGIGRASYCVTGSWSEPVVERLTDEQLEQGAVCAELPPTAAIPKPQQEVAAR